MSDVDAPFDPKTLRMSLTGVLHVGDDYCENMGCRQVYVIDIPDVFDGYSEAELFAKNLRKNAHPNSTTGKIADQIEAQLPKPPKPYHVHDHSSAPWPDVPECHSANDDGHECPQCAWEHEHDWVAWDSECAPGNRRQVPIRCSKCGGRKCDLDACDKQRHTHNHQGDQ